MVTLIALAALYLQQSSTMSKQWYGSGEAVVRQWYGSGEAVVWQWYGSGMVVVVWACDLGNWVC